MGDLTRLLADRKSSQYRLRLSAIPELKGNQVTMVRVPTHRTPTHPGEMLLQEFLVPLGWTQRKPASAIHVPYQRANELVRGRRGITPGTALRLERQLGMPASFWMKLKSRWDLYQARQTEGPALKRIEPLEPETISQQVGSKRGARSFCLTDIVATFQAGL